MGRLLRGVGKDRRFRRFFHPILRVRLTPVAIEQGFDATFGNSILVAIEGVLRSQIARMGGFDLTMCQVIVLFPLQRRYLGISQQDALLGNQFLQGGQALFEGGQVALRSQMERTPDGETKIPRWRSSLLVLT